MTAGIVSFSEWEKLDLRVGQITEIEEIENADKLYKLTIDIGKDNPRIVCAGIKENYSKKELKDKKIILFVNLTPRKIRGIESQGMILAAIDEENDKVILISPEKNISIGSKIR